MDVLRLLAQQQTPTEHVVNAAKTALERFFARYPPEIAVPAFIVGLVAATWIFERAVLGILRRMAKRSDTKIDDALAEGLPTVFRPLVAFAALHVVVQEFLRSDTDPTKLSSDGELANKALMVVAIVAFAIVFVRVATRVADAWVADDVARRPVGPPIKLGLKVAMVPLALLAVLQAIDYPVASLVTALGIGSLAVGLALQDTLKNMFAGIQIVVDHPIRAGDFVEIDKNARGTVTEIGLRSTKLRTPDNNVVVLPNSTIANAMVVNFDVQDQSYVQTLKVAAAYGADMRRVQTILTEVAAAARKDVPGLLDEPAVVSVTDLGESGVAFAVDVKFRQFSGSAAIMTELYHRFYERLRAEGVEIPFPTRIVYLRRGTEPAAATPTAS